MTKQEQDRVRRTLTNLFAYAAQTEVTEADLKEYGVPESFFPSVLEECREIRKLFKNGAQAQARQRASRAAAIALEAFGDKLQPKFGDPRKLADDVFGDSPDLSNPNDPRALAAQIPRWP